MKMLTAICFLALSLSSLAFNISYESKTQDRVLEVVGYKDKIGEPIAYTWRLFKLARSKNYLLISCKFSDMAITPGVENSIAKNTLNRVDNISFSSRKSCQLFQRVLEQNKDKLSRGNSIKVYVNEFGFAHRVVVSDSLSFDYLKK